jgi:hypothetical protein
MACITTCRTCSRTLTCREPVAAVMLPSVFHNYMNCILDPVASCYIRQHISAANHLSAPKYCFFITRKHRHQSTDQNLRICPLVIYLVEPLLGWRKDSPATYGAEPVLIQTCPSFIALRYVSQLINIVVLGCRATRAAVLSITNAKIEKFAEARRRQSCAIAHRARLFVSA